MLFNSFDFIVFFLGVTLMYFLLPFKLRWLMLLAASCLFYMYFIPVYILILFLTIAIDYSAGLLMEKHPHHKKKYLVASIIANVGILFFFKYFNFFVDNINQIAQAAGWNYSIDALKIILPIGLSFHTFQAMSYTIEVYRGKHKAERHLGIYALYVMYYPQLVAGPIERPQNLLHQFHARHSFNFERLLSGLRLMLWGFFKKVVIADRVADFVNKVYDHPADYHPMSIFIACVYFSIQIYCDFSGYCDIARGASRIMGIELMENFRMPYFSKNISEFWTRWHISLSTWFKDYVYIPLGGNRVGKIKWMRNILIVFLISGFWHGASWTFITWGALHGVFTCAAILAAPGLSFFSRKRAGRIISMVFTFFAVTGIWIFFRAENFQQASVIMSSYLLGIPVYIKDFFTNPRFLWVEPLFLNYFIGADGFEFLTVGLAIGILILGDWIFFSPVAKNRFETFPLSAKSALYCMLIIFLLLTGVFHSEQEFIYFQF